MIKPFYVAGSLLLLIVIAMGMHYSLKKKEDITKRINTIAGLTGMSSLSFSVAYYEPRIHGIEKSGNIAYPEMIPVDRMDFVYAK